MRTGGAGHPANYGGGPGQSKGKKSIDDFCHIFHGAPSTGPALKTYTFDDVVNALNQVVPHDWRGFWTERLTNHGPGAPPGGIEGSGWKVVYNDTPSEMLSGMAGMYHIVPAGFALGLSLRDDGGITDTIEDEVAAKAGIGYVPQDVSLYPDLTARENLTFFGRLQTATRAYNDSAPAYLQSHPLTTERIADIQARIRSGESPESVAAEFSKAVWM